MKRWTFILSVALLLLLTAGCGSSPNTEEPPEIVYGQDVCDRCGMIINEENFAAAYWTADGEARRFDDIGGMLAYNTAETEEVASYWVHDFDTSEWIRAEEAHYVLDGDLKTPMAFGIAAFSNSEQAQAFAYGLETVKIQTFAELLDLHITMPEDLHQADPEHSG